ncbi:TonB-dependent receptor plug domain-containing protein [Chryseobacterium scophthalmum]|uniref:TonB-dependent Receptor Plug Domain n=1 Tax=Chryseobacterium scophthalmum TaxID=59733 RepID=A0A1N6EDA2_9FLAO|nr:TonB-dependent receptor plug domain-containing protein [Chryseobacterium scophthalmum]SIN80941.1 TonB-dependent Receptor Plug Domain [Chryseobacterium scophthalmum]
MNISFSQKPLIALSLIVAPFYFSQNKAEEALKKFEENYPQEKIHLLLSKKNYVAGENLWFTSFVFDGYSPSTISTNVFLELYDQNKKQISKKIYPLINGKGSGSISLPANLKEDVYYIRAYTTWMGNFSDDFNEIIPITVYNPSSPEKLVKNTSAPWTAAIFPESGTFIDGINTKFAVRLQSKGETPINWNGFITEAQNLQTKLVTFKGFDQNIGSFNFTPISGKKYQLIVEDDKGIKLTINLPEVVSSGVNLQVQSQSDAIKFVLKGKNIDQNSKYKIIATINSQLVYKANVSNISDRVYSIPTSQLVNGILNLTIFDESENIVAQRLCFVQPQSLKLKQPSLKGTSFSLKPRDSNSFNIGNDSSMSTYLVSVTDNESENPENENSLLSTLWLTGDITSKLYNPAQYFSKNRNIDALDALLISEKWSRFNWQTIMSGNFPAIKYKPENFLSYKGKATKLGKPASEAEINLIFKMPDQGIKYNLIKTDKEGMFTLNGLVFEDSMAFSYQLNGEKTNKNSVRVYFQPSFSFLPFRNNLPSNNYTLVQRNSTDTIPIEIERAVANKSSQTNLREKETLIEEVKIKAQKKDLTKKLNNELSSPLFRSGNETVFDLVNENQNAQGSQNILQYLQGRVAGLQIQMQGGSYTATNRGGPMEFFLDEMRVDANQISNIPVSNIAMVKVIKGNFAGSFGGGNGAVAIYTRRGGTTGSGVDTTLSSNLTEVKLNGYDKEVPFNNGIYDEESAKSVPEDKRSILYWNPYLESKSGEPTIVQWYNNDDAKNFRVMIIGFDENNDLLYYNEVLI